jgi:2-polyprenyl-3-methyl-5-hydroxy-6-metoxy-1,4-benzoquinol methylase
MKAIDIPRENVSCALCGKDDTALLFQVRGQHLQGVYQHGVFRPVVGCERIVRCQQCGLIYVNPRLAPTPGIMTYSVEEERTYFKATRDNRLVGNLGLLRQVEELLGGPGRLLDLGCGDGLLLAQAQRRGWEPWGLEVSAELVANVRAEHNLERIFHGALSQAAYQAAHFDAVTLINVIEHLRDPGETLAEIARIARPGGIVAVHTPNVDSLAARWHRAAWHHYEPFEHFYYFNASTLSRLLEKSGLVVVGSFALPGTSRAKRWLLTMILRLGLRLDNGLGLLARRPI